MTKKKGTDDLDKDLEKKSVDNSEKEIIDETINSKEKPETTKKPRKRTSKKSATVENNEMKCVLCGHTEDQVEKLIAGPPGVYVCDECIKLCNELLEEEIIEETSDLNFENLPKPTELKDYLDEHIIGQDEAKKTLSTAVYNHYKRVLTHEKSKKNDIQIAKSNIMLIGPTGTGKTLLAQTLAKRLNVPFAIADATTLTQAGYVGEDPENILLRLIKDADYDIERAQYGIVYIDEIDKICRKGDNPSITRDVSGEGVQQALLKIIEGTIASVPPQGGRKHPLQENIPIDTTNILFICGGSFDGLEKIIQKRFGKSKIGFGTGTETKKYVEDKKDIFKNVKSLDLMKFGLIPEFVGRVPVITRLQKLETEDMIKVLTEPKNAIIKQYKKLMEIDGIELEFDQDALEYIAEEVIKNNTGARGLRSMIEDIMSDAMFELPSNKDIKKYTVTKAIAEQKNEIA